MRFLRTIVTVLAGFSTPLLAAEVESSMLLYQAQEPGVGTYTSRILVTDRYVRMDDGADDGDYLVFNRKSRLISSVTHDDKTVFEIPPRKITQEPPMKLERRSEVVATKGAPAIAGVKPQQHRLYVNGKMCYNVVVVQGLMPDAVEALSDFRRVLAGEQAKALPHLPADMQEACDLALNTFHPDWQLQFGMPAQEWDETGNGQLLMDFNEKFLVDESLFELPKNYQHYSTDTL